MSNAAEYLLQFFEVEQQPDGFRKDVLPAYTAMCSTERTLDTLIARGVKRLDMAKSQMPGIWKALWESFSDDALDGHRRNFSTLAGATDRLDAAAVLALQTIADRWVELDVRMEDRDRENISGFLSEIEQCLKEDASMPAALKSYVLNLTTEVRRCVNDWESCGSFELNDAMQRLFGALYIAESHTKDQSRWQKIKEKYVGGMFADFIVQIPALALAAVPYIAQIGA